MTDNDRGSRTLHRTRLVLFVFATAVSVLAVLLVVAAWRNDVTIDSDKGIATAEVLSAGKLRSAVSFITPDGVTHNPRLGVLYPTNLVVGQRIEVEYYKADSDGDEDDNDLLVRVAGRDATVAVVPAGSVIVVTWLIAGPALYWLRRKEAVNA
ncbi:DUF3592 domain-containing protein [Rhodococcus sp. 077-4]|uniref:DUF3592 domain-containing protein n=1 Tax=Rhodococcus sp. 077-4 TaxID=2789271 RepID=UPI0039F589CB